MTGLLVVVTFNYWFPIFFYKNIMSKNVSISLIQAKEYHVYHSILLYWYVKFYEEEKYYDMINFYWNDIGI